MTTGSCLGISINGPFNHIRHKEGLEGISDIPFVNLLEEEGLEGISDIPCVNLLEEFSFIITMI